VIPTIRIGIVGYGYWGPNLVRVFSEAPGCRVVAVSDLRPEQLTRAQARYPSVRVTLDADDLLTDPALDAIVIATPVSTHFDLARRALDEGKHVLVEKPLTATVAQAEELVAKAERHGLRLMVDHTFVYTGAVRKIKELVQNGSLGKIYYYDSVRVNLGLFQHDVNVLWDLAVHDLAIMDHVLADRPVSVSVTGMAHVAGQPENIAYVTCFFATNLIAHFHVNWLAPVKIRRTLIGGDRRMIVYDDLEADEKIRVYDKGVVVSNSTEAVYRLMVGYRAGDMAAPALDRSEALHIEALDFVDSIRTGRPPLTDGASGLRVVRLLDAAARSLAEGGRIVDVTSPSVGVAAASRSADPPSAVVRP
jgi:predicted dehydrogenase